MPETEKASTRVIRIFRSPVTWVVLLTVAYLVILIARPGPRWFGVPDQWTWPGRPPSPSTIPRWWPAASLLVLLVGGGLYLDRRWHRLSSPRRLTWLALLATLTIALQVLLTHVHFRHVMESYLYRTIGPHNGFWQAAIGIESIVDYLKTYPEQMRASQGVFVHLPTHPPGNILSLWLWRRIFEMWSGPAHAIAHWLRGYYCAEFSFVTLEDAQIAATVGQMIVPVLSGFAVGPLYLWTRDLDGPRTAWRASWLYSLTPALSLFTMRWDSLYPIFVTAAFFLLHRGLTQQRPSLWFACGIMISVASFASFGNATFAPAAALYAAAFLVLTSGLRGLLRAWRGWLALLLGGYSIWGLYDLSAGVSVWEVFATTLETHLHLGRDYWPWVAYNLYDLIVFSGVPVGVLYVLAVGRSPQHLIQRKQLALLPAAVSAISLLTVNLSGVVRGEVGRIWLPWMPLLALSAAVSIRTLRSRWTLPLVGALMAVQSFGMTLYLRVAHTGLPSYQPRTIEAHAQQNLTEEANRGHRVDAVFSDRIALEAYELKPSTPEPGKDLEVAFYWRALRRPDLPYTVFVHLVDADGQLVDQSDAMPANNELPTSCWLDGEIVRDVHRLSVPADRSFDEYTLRVGLYYWPTSDRLPLTHGGEGDALNISVTVAESES